jgi:hypothetical protein
LIFLFGAADMSRAATEMAPATVATGELLGQVAAVKPATYYAFRSRLPELGCCEQQFFRRPGMAEPVNLIFSLTTVVLGLLGLLRSRRTTIAFQFLYGLLVAYGVFAVAYHATLSNGFYRMKDVALSMLQSFVIVMLAHTLYLYRVKREGRASSEGYRILVCVMTVIFTIYPSAVHVAGESTPDPKVAWIVFDGLWAVILLELFFIWRRRFTWPPTPLDAGVFRLVWYAFGAAVLAYAGWCADHFLCNKQTPVLAHLGLHGWWHFFIGLCFYDLITLCRFFSAHEYGFEPIFACFPARGFGVLSIPLVEWKSRRRQDPGNDWKKAPIPVPPAPLGDPGTDRA